MTYFFYVIGVLENLFFSSLHSFILYLLEKLSLFLHLLILKELVLTYLFEVTLEIFLSSLVGIGVLIGVNNVIVLFSGGVVVVVVFLPNDH